MKRLIISILLLSISFGFTFFSYNYLKAKTNEFDSILSECTQLIDSENYEKAEQKIQKAESYWKSNEKIFDIMIESSFCETVENSLNDIKFCFYEEEYTEAKRSISECRNTLMKITENEKLSLETVL